MAYTDADVNRVFNQDMGEIHAHLERRATEQRPEVCRVIANLTGTTPPAEEDTERPLDSHDQDTELDPEVDEQ